MQQTLDSSEQPANLRSNAPAATSVPQRNLQHSSENNTYDAPSSIFFFMIFQKLIPYIVEEFLTTSNVQVLRILLVSSIQVLRILLHSVKVNIKSLKWFQYFFQATRSGVAHPPQLVNHNTSTSTSYQPKPAADLNIKLAAKLLNLHL